MADGVRVGAPPGGAVEWVPVGDWATLRVAHWRPSNGPRGSVLLLSGRTEFIEKYHEVISDLLSREYFVWTFDWRGQGLSSRMLPNRHKGHIDHYQTYLNDLREALRRSLPSDVPEARLVLAHSMGGHVALHYAAQFQDWARGLVLSAPMVDIRMPGIARAVSRVVAKTGAALGFGGSYVPGGGDYGEKQAQFEGNPLTHDRRRFENMAGWIAHNSDLALGAPTLGWLSASLKSAALLQQESLARKIVTPTLVLSAGEDTVVSNAAQHAVCVLMPQARIETISGSRHEPLMETDDIRDQFWAAFDRFADEVLA